MTTTDFDTLSQYLHNYWEHVTGCYLQKTFTKEEAKKLEFLNYDDEDGGLIEEDYQALLYKHTEIWKFINWSKHQEKRKKLPEMKKTKVELLEIIEDLRDDVNFKTGAIANLEKENKQLQKELDELQESLDAGTRKMYEENKKLKELEEDYAPLEEYMSGMTGIFDCGDVVKELERLKYENDEALQKLEEEKEKSQQQNNQVIVDNKKNHKDYRELYDENKKLRKMCEVKEELVKDNYFKYIEEKAQCEGLQKQMDYLHEHPGVLLWKAHGIDYVNECSKLKDKLANLKKVVSEF